MIAIRKAEPSDASSLLNIYKAYIETPITFEYEIPTVEEFERRITDISKEYPYIVCQVDGRIVGYAYAHRHRERAAYQWNAELSVYLSNMNKKKGIGKALYKALIEILKLQNIKTVYGCITVPNPRSEGLHKSLGFQPIGIYHNAGYKCGQWHDVLWVEKQIGDYNIRPTNMLSIQQIDTEKTVSIFENSILPIKL